MLIKFDKETDKIVLDLSGNTMFSENEVMCQADQSFVDFLQDHGVNFVTNGGRFIGTSEEQTALVMSAKVSPGSIEGNVKHVSPDAYSPALIQAMRKQIEKYEGEAE